MKTKIFVSLLAVLIGAGIFAAWGHSSATMPVAAGLAVQLSNSTDDALPISHSGFILAKYKYNPNYPTSRLGNKQCTGTTCPAPTCYRDGSRQICPGDPNKQPIIPGDCVGPQC